MVTDTYTMKSELPYSTELRTSSVLDILEKFLAPNDGESAHDFRERLQARLYNRAKPNFHIKLSESFHLSYVNQRDGHGTQHYWMVHYDDVLKAQIEALAKGSSLTVANRTQGAENAPFEFGGLYLRSEAEMAIAEELNRRDVLFFANVRGRVSTNSSPVSEHQSNGRVELDFLVFVKGKAIALEVDGRQHNEQRNRDYAKDRLMLREGIPTARFTAQECLNSSVAVVDEFLFLFGKS